jgi:hypothetical protein
VSWIDTLLFGYNTVAAGGVAAVQRRIVNFVNGTAVDNPTFKRTDVTTSGAIGGGIPSSTQSGAVILPAVSSVIEVYVDSPATCNMAQLSSPSTGLAFQFNLISSSSSGAPNGTLTFSGGSFSSVANQGAIQSSLVVSGSGQSITITRNSLGQWQTL